MTSSSLHFGVWNLRGLNDPLKQKAAKKFLNNNDLSLFGLVEHKVKEPNIKKVVNFICPHWLFAHNSDQAPIGRILICWNPLLLAVKVLTRTIQLMHCEIQDIHDGHVFLATFCLWC